MSMGYVVSLVYGVEIEDQDFDGETHDGDFVIAPVGV